MTRMGYRGVGEWCGVLMLAAVGCAAEHDADSGGTTKDVEAELAALMSDGELPANIANMPAPPPSARPRFCGGSVIGLPIPVGSAGAAAPTPPIASPPRAVPSGLPIAPPAVRGGSGGSASAAGSGGAPVVITGGVGGSSGAPPDKGGAGGSGDGSGGSEPDCSGTPIGFWQFDDCNDSRTDLNDSSFQGHSAFRSVSARCVAGHEGQAVGFETRDDLVYAPDQPDFALDAGVTVAAWVKADAVDHVRTLFRKRDDGDSAFALVINQGKFQFVVRLASGRLFSVTAPATADTWTHVAATYDGEMLRLYLDGSEVSHTRARGVLAQGAGPLLIGNDADGRRFEGVIDNAWFNVLAAPPATILHLTCLHRDPALSVSPAMSDAVSAGTPVTYMLGITNTQGPACEDASFFVSVGLPGGEFSAEPSFASVTVASGESSNVPVVVSSGTETEPGPYPINFGVSVQNFGFPGIVVSAPPLPLAAAKMGGGGAPVVDPPVVVGPTGFVNVTAQYVVAEPAGCHVSSPRELMIRDLSVVEDPVRTVVGSDAAGAWTFEHLMQTLSPTAAPDVTQAMLQTFLSPQTVNSFSIPERPTMNDLVLQPWPRTSDGKLDLARAPVRLLAIVHRTDLIDLARSKAGEGRFIFGVLDPSGSPMEFTIIFEYRLAAENEADVRGWQDAVHALQALPFPSETYNQALQALTDRFAVPSALLDVRTNEIALGFEWQLREFHLSPETGALDPATIFQTPDASFNNTQMLADFIQQNEAAILAETHEAPPLFENAPFQGAFVFNNIDVWDAPGVTNAEARHKFSLNTCNGCHGGETQTAFLQVSPRVPGQVAQLSNFLTGETVTDIRGVTRRLSELLRRRQLLEKVVCAAP